MPAKIFLILYFLYGLSSVSLAQSLSQPSENWKIDSLDSGLTLYSFQADSLFGRPQSLSVLIIDLKESRFQLALAYEDSLLRKTSQFAQSFPHSRAALNGSFFDPKKGGSVCFLKVDQKIISPVRHQGRAWFWSKSGALAIHKQKRVRIIKRKKRDATWLKSSRGYDQVMAGGPLLVWKGEALKFPANFPKKRHPRSALGLDRDQRLIWLVADGRHAKASGLNLDELARLMQNLGAHWALNLDGGGSSTLWIRNYADVGIVNHPSDNKKFDSQGERGVANALILLDLDFKK